MCKRMLKTLHDETFSKLLIDLSGVDPIACVFIASALMREIGFSATSDKGKHKKPSAPDMHITLPSCKPQWKQIVQKRPLHLLTKTCIPFLHFSHFPLKCIVCYAQVTLKFNDVNRGQAGKKKKSLNKASRIFFCSNTRGT